MARYRKVDQRLWTDERFRGLDVESKLVALYLLTSAQVNRVGLYVLSMARAAEEIGIDVDTCRAHVAHVCGVFGWGFDEPVRTVSVVYLDTWWRYNAPENPSVLKSCLQDIHDLPTTPLLARFAQNLQDLPGHCRRVFHRWAKGMTRDRHVSDTSATSVAVAVTVSKDLSTKRAQGGVGGDTETPAPQPDRKQKQEGKAKEKAAASVPDDPRVTELLERFRQAGGRVSPGVRMRLARYVARFGFDAMAEALARAADDIVTAERPLNYWRAVAEKPRPAAQTLLGRRAEIVEELP